MFKISKIKVLPALVLCFALSGCGVIDYYYLPVPTETVQELFEAGNDAMEEKNYSKAIGYFARIRDEFTFSPYALEAELSLGDAYFMSEEYVMAADIFKEFEAMHPRHEAVPYALYKAASALRLSYRSVDRASAPVVEAEAILRRIQRAYPDTEYAAKATEEIAACRRLQAEREAFIGDVFWGMKNYEAAWTRYKDVVAKFPDVEEVARYAKEKGDSSYLLFREMDAEEVRRQKEGSWRNMFRWL